MWNITGTLILSGQRIPASGSYTGDREHAMERFVKQWTQGGGDVVELKCTCVGTTRGEGNNLL